VRPARSPCAATPRRGSGGRSEPSGADDGSHRRQTRSGPSSPQPRPRTGRSDSAPPARWQRFPPRSPSPNRSPDPTPCVYDRPPATSPILHCAPPPLFRFATTSEPPAEPLPEPGLYIFQGKKGSMIPLVRHGADDGDQVHILRSRESRRRHPPRPRRRSPLPRLRPATNHYLTGLRPKPLKRSHMSHFPQKATPAHAIRVSVSDGRRHLAPSRECSTHVRL
jgi:hypothetical protein